VTPTLILAGVHHVAVPVTDILRSRDWYASVLEFIPVLDEESEDAITEVTLEHASGNLTLCLYAAPRAAQALAGFTPFGLAVPSAVELERWKNKIASLGVPHTPIRPAHLGWVFDLTDPDEILIQLRTPEALSGDAE
jgi:catechol 2,3-dioxygenase-like lactoylglutathione lyase family enzyme